MTESSIGAETYEKALERWIRWLSGGPRLRYRHGRIEPHFHKMLNDRYVAMTGMSFVLTDSGRAYGVEHGWITQERSTEAI